MDDDGQGDNQEASSIFSDPSSVEDLTRKYLDALEDLLAALPPEGARPREGGDSEIMFLLVKAQAAWLTASFRYWRQLAGIFAEQGLGLRDLARLDGSEAGAAPQMHKLALLDKARACMREVGDMSLSEATRLRARFAEIEAELRAVADVDMAEPEQAGAAPRRRGRAKP